MMGSLRGSVRSTTGRVACWGRTLSSVWSRSRTLSTAKSMSVPQTNRTVTRDTPSRLMLSTCWAPGTRARAPSMGAETNRSTSAGPTPAYWVWTTSFGYATSGSRSMGSRANEIIPRNPTATNSIATATGRRMDRRGRLIGSTPTGPPTFSSRVSSATGEAEVGLEHVPLGRRNLVHHALEAV
jgi:hypothetical protein